MFIAIYTKKAQTLKVYNPGVCRGVKYKSLTFLQNEFF